MIISYHYNEATEDKVASYFPIKQHLYGVNPHFHRDLRKESVLFSQNNTLLKK